MAGEGIETFYISVESKIEALLLLIEGYKEGILTKEELVAYLVDILYQAETD